MDRRCVAAVVAALAVLLGSASPAVSGYCGDDVGGVRIPCNCGDIVAGDVHLLATDPIARTRCPLDGLIVRGAPTAESVTVDLGGLTLRGSGLGIGILVERGGTDGAIIAGGTGGQNAQIIGFGTGIVSAAPSALARLEHVTTKGNSRDGVRVREAGIVMLGVTSTDNGGDGLRVLGSGGRIVRVYAARNAGSGLVVAAPGIIVEGTAEDNGRHGIVSSGPGSDLRGAVARGNGGAGIVAGTRQRIDGAVAEWNRMGDIRIRRGRR